MASNFTTERTAMNDTYIVMQQDSTPIRILKVLACSIILVIALVGNIFIILVVRQKNANMKKTINFFIMNMALSDLVVPIVILPRVIVANLLDSSIFVTWRGSDGIPGNILCKFVFFVSDLTMVVSILSIICIAIDRFCAVVFPMKLSLVTSRIRWGLIIFTWLFSIACFTPYLYGFKLVEIHGGQQVCTLIWSEDETVHFKIQHTIAIVASILFTLIPAILLTVMYTVILVVARIQIVPDQQHTNTAVNRRQANNNKLLKLALLTVGSFAICYGPYNVFLFYLSINLNWNMAQKTEISTFKFVAQFLTYANSALNPCLYFIFIENYRRGLKRILRLTQEPKNRNIPELTSRLTSRATGQSRLQQRSEEDLLRTPLKSESRQNGLTLNTTSNLDAERH
ncbi:QRFP-like peptide receptor [Actinia tenebrosa]|uniref:QRFP-like peptide receptor n=1 Tax=Actinia tenebrosa TaxID=6105 RepID=A0A6P8IJB8_ACTTE|nr:QRFP-like peptide receptor [Actinia tenebrosa]